MTDLTGGCLCGSVRFSAGVPMICGHCQCVDCRRTSATGHATHAAVAASSFSVTGALTAYSRPADSGNVVTRHFCPECGSAIHSTNGAVPAMIFIRASALDDPEVISPQMLVYASRGPSWDRIEGLPTFAEMAPMPEA